jgi:hypothetical protein
VRQLSTVVVGPVVSVDGATGSRLNAANEPLYVRIAKPNGQWPTGASPAASKSSAESLGLVGKAKNPTIPPRLPRKATPMKIQGVELDSDAWPKFEKLIKSAAKMGPKPHVAEPRKPKRGGSG